jgi:class 3 adenylate cyclase
LYSTRECCLTNQGNRRAAKGLHAAGGTDILVPDETRRRAGDAIRFIPGAEARVRGKAAPLPTWVPVVEERPDDATTAPE